MVGLTNETVSSLALDFDERWVNEYVAAGVGDIDVENLNAAAGNVENADANVVTRRVTTSRRGMKTANDLGEMNESM